MMPSSHVVTGALDLHLNVRQNGRVSSQIRVGVERRAWQHCRLQLGTRSFSGKPLTTAITAFTSSYDIEPLLTETTTYLTSGERLATPRWSSFCNSCAGVWIGRSASFERPISRDCDIDISAGFRLVQETGHLRVIRSNGRSIDETLTIMKEVNEGPKNSTPASRNTDSDEPGFSVKERETIDVYFEDGTYTSGATQLSKVFGETRQNFDFNIIAPGGAECARVSQTVFLSPSAQFCLGRVVVSIEKWLGPERVYSDVNIEEEAKKLKEIATLPTEPVESAVGEWRSFNRLAVPTSLVDDEENSRAQESTAGTPFNFECEETIQRARILSEEDGDDVLLAQHISLPGGITTGVIVSGNSLVISAGWSTARGVCKVVEREYEHGGATKLLEVRDSSRVFDRWVGGEM